MVICRIFESTMWNRMNIEHTNNCVIEPQQPHTVPFALKLSIISECIAWKIIGKEQVVFTCLPCVSDPRNFIWIGGVRSFFMWIRSESLHYTSANNIMCFDDRMDGYVGLCILWTLYKWHTHLSFWIIMDIIVNLH